MANSWFRLFNTSRKQEEKIFASKKSFLSSPKFVYYFNANLQTSFDLGGFIANRLHLANLLKGKVLHVEAILLRDTPYGGTL